MVRAARPRLGRFGRVDPNAWAVVILLGAVVAAGSPAVAAPLGSLSALAPIGSTHARYGVASSLDGPGSALDPSGSSASRSLGLPAANMVNDSPGVWLGDPGPGPAPRTDAAFAYSPSEGAVFGGYTNTSPACNPFTTCALGQTWVRPDSSGAWVNVTPGVPSATNTPSDRWGSAMAYDPAIDSFVLFGGTTAFPNGFNNPALGDTWLLASGSSAWAPACTACVPGTSEPIARWGAAAAYDPASGKVVLFGGESTTRGTAVYYNDTWAFNGMAWAPLALATAPSNRSGAAFARDSERGTSGALVLFGGFPASSDTWLFENGNWSSVTPATAPPAMGGAAAATDPINGSVTIFGGCPSDPCHQARSLSGTPWSWSSGAWHALRPKVSGAPVARYDAALFEDGPNGSLVLFGGWNGTASANDTWSFYHIEARSVKASSYTLDIGGTVTLNESSDGGYGALSYQWEGLPSGCATQDTAVLVCDPSGAGPYILYLRVAVSDQLMETVLSPTTTVRFNAVPYVDPLARPTSGIVPLQVSFSATDGGGTGTIDLNWSFGDGGVGTGSTPTHTYNVGGNFTAAVWANDSLGTSTERTIAIEVIPLLIVHLTINPDPWTITGSGNAAVVQASASGGVGPYNYTFGPLPSGCEQVSAATPTYDCRPSAAGTFWISVTATDKSGQHDQVNKTLTVLAPSTSSPSGSSAFGFWDYAGVAVLIAAILLVVALVARRRGRRRPPRPMTSVPVPEPHEMPAAGGSLYVPPPGPTGRAPKRRI